MFTQRLMRPGRTTLAAAMLAVVASGSAATAAPAALHNESLFQLLYAGSTQVASISGALDWTSDGAGHRTGFALSSVCLRDVNTDGSAVKASTRWDFADGTRVQGPTWSTGGTTCTSYSMKSSRTLSSLTLTLRRSLFGGGNECVYYAYGAKVCRVF